MGTRLYFSAWEGMLGYELWAHEISNGSTWRVEDIASGSSSSNPQTLATIGEKLYFSAEEGSTGRELWVHNSLNQSTWMVTDLNPGTSGSNPNQLTALGPRLLFGAYDGTDYLLWGLISESTPAY